MAESTIEATLSEGWGRWRVGDVAPPDLPTANCRRAVLSGHADMTDWFPERGASTKRAKAICGGEEVALCGECGHCPHPDGICGRVVDGERCGCVSSNERMRIEYPACPERDNCLDHALDTKEAWGIWGGLATGDRRKVRREREYAAGERIAAGRIRCG